MISAIDPYFTVAPIAEDIGAEGLKESLSVYLNRMGGTMALYLRAWIIDSDEAISVQILGV